MPDPEMAVEKKSKKENVPLQEALNTVGIGKYTVLLILSGASVHFAADCGVQIMSFIIPAASCDLKLSGYEKGILGAMGITGMLTSSHICGVLADVYGRRKVLVYSVILQAMICVVSSLAPNALTLMICWFLYGNAAAGVMTPILVYIHEFCPDNVKTTSVAVLVGAGALAESYLPSVAWLIIPLDIRIELVGGLVFTSWRLYLAALTIPILISLFLLLRLPESPKFVLNQGRMDETLHTLQEMYSVNNNDEKQNFPISSIQLDLEDKLVQGDSENGRSVLKFLKSMLTQTTLLFNRTFIGYTILSSLVMFGIGGTAMTIMFWLPDEVTNVLRYADSHNSTAGICEIVPHYITSQNSVATENVCEVKNDVFLLAIILGFSQLISFTLMSLVADRWSKKLILGFLLIVPGLLSILILYVKATYWIIGILILTSTFPTSSYPISISLLMNYFPTSIRSNAASVTMVVGRIGITVYNLVYGLLLESNCNSAFWAMSASLIGTALLCIIMPATRKIKS